MSSYPYADNIKGNSTVVYDFDSSVIFKFCQTQNTACASKKNNKTTKINNLEIPNKSKVKTITKYHNSPRATTAIRSIKCFPIIYREQRTEKATGTQRL